MKHVLIPTDFSIGSLQPVPAALQHFPGAPVRITLLHLLEPPDSIGELLFRAARREPAHLAGPEFRQACAVIRNRYGSRLTDLRTDIRYGSTAAYVRHLLESLEADAIALDPAYRPGRPDPRSVTLIPLLLRMDLPVIRPSAPPEEKPFGTPSVGALLLGTPERRETPALS